MIPRTPYADPLVSPASLARALDAEDLVVLDARVLLMRSGPLGDREAYAAGHLPGAIYADVPGHLCDPDVPMAFAMPTAQRFAEALGVLGVGDSSDVVIYDDAFETPSGPIAGLFAARVWWMLRWIGFDRARVLDGGYAAWMRAGLPVSTQTERPLRRTVTPDLRADLIADRDEVSTALGDPRVTLVDVLDADHFAGRHAMYPRPGHIPGAVNRPFSELFDDAGCFRALTPEAVIEQAGKGGRTIAYCGGGIAASAYALAMTRAGVDNLAVYAASLQEWAADPTLPMEL